MRVLLIAIVVSSIWSSSLSFAQSQNCVFSDGKSGCISADAKGVHIKEVSKTSSQLDISAGGYTALSVDSTGVKFSEPGAAAISGLSPLITLNETNLLTNNKHGIYGRLRTTNGSTRINANLLSLEIFTPPDNGGDVSAAYIRQTGGGNAMSLFNLCSQRPSGFSAYCSQGFALEAQVDGSKNSVFASAVEGSSLLAVVKGRLGTGLSVYPSGSTLPAARAIHVATADNSKETFFVDMSGQVYARGRLTTDGGIVAYNITSSLPIFEAVATRDQAAFFADAKSPRGIAFLAKPDSEADTFATAFQVQDVQGRSVAAVSMKGAAAYSALAINGQTIKPTLQATSSIIGGETLELGHCAEGKVHIPGALASMAVVVSPAGSFPGDGFFWEGFASDTDAVIIKICNSSGGRASPVAARYNVRVVP